MCSDSELIAFLNPDKSLGVIIENKEEAAKTTYRLAETKDSSATATFIQSSK